jgi:hypothetical protein
MGIALLNPSYAGYSFGAGNKSTVRIIETISSAAFLFKVKFGQRPAGMNEIVEPATDASAEPHASARQHAVARKMKHNQPIKRPIIKIGLSRGVITAFRFRL